ncbi:MAG: family hydrolase [Solimicrobium sp.]|jgi:phosphoglycolate phosphatase|nr:family hydrolase [Solimicrobium sp.]
MTISFKPRAVLFDLDGTLADTAPDLAAAVNRMRIERNLSPAPFAQLRPHASAGARGLLKAGFGITPEDVEFEAMRLEFLNNYEASICQHSRLFDGIAELIVSIHRQGIPWGIVTNKITRFTQPLIPLLGLQQAQCVISGDTTTYFKPHPEPLFEAARQLQFTPQECCYIGDDLRDMQAAQAAGMFSIAAAWGYCGRREAESWRTDLLLSLPSDLLKLVV